MPLSITQYMYMCACVCLHWSTFAECFSKCEWWNYHSVKLHLFRKAFPECLYLVFLASIGNCRTNCTHSQNPTNMLTICTKEDDCFIPLAPTAFFLFFLFSVFFLSFFFFVFERAFWVVSRFSLLAPSISCQKISSRTKICNKEEAKVYQKKMIKIKIKKKKTNTKYMNLSSTF